MARERRSWLASDVIRSQTQAKPVFLTSAAEKTCAASGIGLDNDLARVVKLSTVDGGPLLFRPVA